MPHSLHSEMPPLEKQKLKPSSEIQNSIYVVHQERYHPDQCLYGASEIVESAVEFCSCTASACLVFISTQETQVRADSIILLTKGCKRSV